MAKISLLYPAQHIQYTMYMSSCISLFAQSSPAHLHKLDKGKKHFLFNYTFIFGGLAKSLFFYDGLIKLAQCKIQISTWEAPHLSNAKHNK
jgi:hypothetical protein